MKKIMSILAITVLAVALIAATVSSFSVEASNLVAATVTRVIDGDTIELSNGQRVRLIGVDAPEIGETGAAAATAFTRARVEGRTVWLEADGNNTDVHGRLRRYVWVRRPTNQNNEAQIRAHMLNAMLLEHNHARPLIVGAVRHEALFRSLAATPVPRFIGNANTNVFHVASCGSLPAIHNRIYFQTRANAISFGQNPCGTCRP
ncbi:MAG: thermonuclease family protein [Defluviitaleaceae bacterium]|nr:thermonuclease family protein [Defluviitaleaceae bacterium]